MQVFSLEEAGGQSKLAEEDHPAQRKVLTKCNCVDDNVLVHIPFFPIFLNISHRNPFMDPQIFL